MNQFKPRRPIPGLEPDPAETITFHLHGGIASLPDHITALTLAAGLVQVGDPAVEHLQLTPTAFQLKDGATVWAQLTASAFTMGRSSAEHVRISGSGIKIKDGATVRGEWDSDGDLFLGSDTSAAATTYLSVFAAAQTYNGESMAAGDMLIGDNSSAKANILWDKSSGQMLFRGGTTPQAYLDTDGALTAGGGNVILDANGISTLANSSYAAAASHGYTLRDDAGTPIAGLYAAAVAARNHLMLELPAQTAHDAQLNISARSNSSDTAVLTLTADDDSSPQTISLQAGVTTPQIAISGDLLNLNTSALILPRRTTSQRDALTPINGMVLYNSSTGRVEAYESGAWVDL